MIQRRRGPNIGATRALTVDTGRPDDRMGRDHRERRSLSTGPPCEPFPGGWKASQQQRAAILGVYEALTLKRLLIQRGHLNAIAGPLCGSKEGGDTQPAGHLDVRNFQKFG